MTTLIIDIRETSLRALFRNESGKFEYSRTFEFDSLKDYQREKSEYHQISIHDFASDNPNLRECYNLWDREIKESLKTIRSEIKTSIGATHLIIPPYEVISATHQLPKISRQDAEKLIGRKISAEFKEEYPPFSIIPGASDQKTQSWYSFYIPSATLKLYRKAFLSSKLNIKSITTPVNAMINAFQANREAIFNTHAVFEIQRGFVEAYYISNDGILHFGRLSYGTSVTASETDNENEKTHKYRIFKILNTIFSINSIYQTANPQIPVQMAWICGLESGLDEIAASLKEAMSIEVGIAPPVPSGLPGESGYVPLIGFATALLSETATSYVAAKFFRRFPLRKRFGFIIYAIATVIALLAFGYAEREYRKLRSDVQSLQLSADPKQNKAKADASASYVKNLETLKKLTSNQFVFYDLFRELANNLPGDVYLEDINFRLKDDTGLLDITAVIRLSDKTGEGKLLGKLMEMINHSPTLKNHREPSITVVTKVDKERYLKINVTSEVYTLDTKK